MLKRLVASAVWVVVTPMPRSWRVQFMSACRGKWITLNLGPLNIGWDVTLEGDWDV